MGGRVVADEGARAELPGTRDDGVVRGCQAPDARERGTLPLDGVIDPLGDLAGRAVVVGPLVEGDGSGADGGCDVEGAIRVDDLDGARGPTLDAAPDGQAVGGGAGRPDFNGLWMDEGLRPQRRARP